MNTENIFRFLHDFLINKGLSETAATYLNLFIGILIVLGTAFLLDWLASKVIRSIFYKIAPKTKSNFDDYLIKSKTPEYLAHVVPVVFILACIPYLFYAFPTVEPILETVADIYLIVLSLFIIRSILRTSRDYLKSLAAFKDKPIDSYIQVFMIFAWGAGIILIFSILTDKSFLAFLTTLGALSAVILLIFKDTILGFVASIQVAVNDMVRIGDWITMEKYGADGDVIEINLATVKVQNFDKTITTIPTYALISDSFKNWRGMSESGGRRIKRAIIIKTQSIHYLSDEEIQALQKIELVSDYIKHRQQDIQDFNTQIAADKSVLINGRNLTNIGVFRKYVEAYLERHPAINKDMTIMSRQLSQTPQGIPIEIYAFSKDKVWKNYEHIMGDIFDHLLAAVPYFNLETYELNVVK